MKNIKILLIISVVSIISPISITSLLASNVGRHVYGLVSEMYNGAHFDNFSQEDAMSLDTWSGQGVATFKNSDENTTNIIEGNNCNTIVINRTSGWEVFVFRPAYMNASNTAPKNMSSYYGGAVKFLVRSSFSSFLTAKVGVQLNTSSTGHKVKTLSQLGFVADGNWHEISIPLNSDFGISSDSDLSSVIGLFTFQPMSLITGHSIDIDNVRWVKPGTGIFNATLKNIDDDSDATKITWDPQSVFKQRWTVANQYLELDLDMDMTPNWTLKIYTNNGSVNKKGLVDTSSGTSVLPMCWRILKRKMPYDYYDWGGQRQQATFDIGEDLYEENGEIKGRLYDSGIANPEPTYNTWFYFLDYSDKNNFGQNEEDYVTCWKLKGFHSAAGADNYWGMYDGADDTVMTEGRYPKIYFGADFEKAGGGLSYSSLIRLELNYE